eukprot:gene25361-11023_t
MDLELKEITTSQGPLVSPAHLVTRTEYEVFGGFQPAGMDPPEPSVLGRGLHIYCPKSSKAPMQPSGAVRIPADWIISRLRSLIAQRYSSVSVCKPVRAYGEDSKYFDLTDMENTTGSWDMYGQDSSKRYPELQSTFWTQAADIITRRESFMLFAAGTGGTALTLFGLIGSKDAKLPITMAPVKTENGKGGTISSKV